jgi:L-glyceraldehyde 3-phosphate reductase
MEGSKLFDEGRYDSMIYRKCGKWGLKLPAISLGCWETYGGYVDAVTSRECLFRAFDLGVTHFDLANNYGRPPGNAEIVVGKIIKEMPRDELIISTKAGYPMWAGPYGNWGSRKYLLASADQSLKRLGLDYVDIFYSHRPDPATPLEETIGALDQLVRQGKALYVGVSNYSGEAFSKASEVVAQHDWAPLTIHQPCYNMLGRDIENDLLPAIRKEGAGVIAFCPLAQGLLTTKYLDGIPSESRAALWWNEAQRNSIDERRIRKIGKLNEIAKSRGQTLAQMALAWVLRRPELTSALIGASRVSQITENVATLKNLQFTKEELAQIDSLTLRK